jgi:hypothetical protein
LLAVTRYALSRLLEDQPTFLMACYEPDMDGITYTFDLKDACTYVSFEKAADVARTLQRLHGYDLMIVVVQEDV